ncbi:MAG TPA: SCO1664 family protein [Actinomycetes bacterium]|nr:SCO1664 family protein [Actinomycetes bacterium]
MTGEPAKALRQPSTDAEALHLLAAGDLVVEGRLVDASNATLFCTISHEDIAAEAIYKPRAGERPLWDFPSGTLGRRELAAYVVSEALGWHIVPPTIWRNGQLGPGMVQLWIDVDEEVDVVALVRSDRADLRRVAVFDVVINNADRKGGHLLPTPSGRVYGIDHGVAFSVEDKVRTLLWQWEGQPLPADIVTDLELLGEAVGRAPLRSTLASLLSQEELAATAQRIQRLLTCRRHPGPSPDWPAIPWPPF